MSQHWDGHVVLPKSEGLLAMTYGVGKDTNGNWQDNRRVVPAYAKATAGKRVGIDNYGGGGWGDTKIYID